MFKTYEVRKHCPYPCARWVSPIFVKFIQECDRTRYGVDGPKRTVITLLEYKSVIKDINMRNLKIKVAESITNMLNNSKTNFEDINFTQFYLFIKFDGTDYGILLNFCWFRTNTQMMTVVLSVLSAAINDTPKRALR